MSISDKLHTQFMSLQGKGEKVPEIPAEVRRGVKDYRKAVFKQVTPVLEKVAIMR